MRIASPRASERLLNLAAANAAADSVEFEYGMLAVDWSRGSAASPTGRVTLLRTELCLLAALLASQGKPVSYEDLIKCVWPRAAMEGRSFRALRIHIRSLRQRLASIGVASALRTVRGVGYVMKA